MQDVISETVISALSDRRIKISCLFSSCSMVKTGMHSVRMRIVLLLIRIPPYCVYMFKSVNLL